MSEYAPHEAADQLLNGAFEVIDAHAEAELADLRGVANDVAASDDAARVLVGLAVAAALGIDRTAAAHGIDRGKTRQQFAASLRVFLDGPQGP